VHYQTEFHGDTLVSHTPPPKQYLDRFSHFCTAEAEMSLYFTMAAPSP